MQARRREASLKSCRSKSNILGGSTCAASKPSCSAIAPSIPQLLPGFVPSPGETETPTHAMVPSILDMDLDPNAVGGTDKDTREALPAALGQQIPLRSARGDDSSDGRPKLPQRRSVSLVWSGNNSFTGSAAANKESDSEVQGYGPEQRRRRWKSLPAGLKEVISRVLTGQDTNVAPMVPPANAFHGNSAGKSPKPSGTPLGAAFMENIGREVAIGTTDDAGTSRYDSLTEQQYYSPGGSSSSAVGDAAEAGVDASPHRRASPSLGLGSIALGLSLGRRDSANRISNCCEETHRRLLEDRERCMQLSKAVGRRLEKDIRVARERASVQMLRRRSSGDTDGV